MKLVPIAFGYSWLGILNMLVLQWLFIRLLVTCNDTGYVMTYNIIGPIVPMTGWWSDFIWLKPR